jgi:hypothetical protein
MINGYDDIDFLLSLKDEAFEYAERMNSVQRCSHFELV